MNDEGDLWGVFNQKWPEIYWQRIESPLTGTGIPDVYFCYKGFAGWVELKFIKRLPKHDSTIVRLPHYTDDQRLWLKDNMEAGGHSLLCLGVGDSKKILWYYGKQALTVGVISKEQLLQRGANNLFKLIAQHHRG